jgi:predicted phage tail protein
MRRNIAGIVCVIAGVAVLVFSLFSFDALGGDVWSVGYSVAAKLGLSFGACLVIGGIFLLRKTNN